MSTNHFIPFDPKRKDPNQECRFCKHYVPFRTDEGYQDWVRGKCRHTGLSTVPPRHTCDAWASRKGNQEL